MANQNMLDKVIAAISPTHAMRRAAARAALEIINTGYGNYGANLTKKSMRGWDYAGGSAKEDIEDNIMRVESKEIAAELLETTFGQNIEMEKW